MLRQFENRVRALLLTAAIVAPSLAHAGAMEDAILAEINFARMHPQEYAARLRAEPVTKWERALLQAGQDDQDPDAYEEALAHLEEQAPLRPLSRDAALASAAYEHVSAQGPVGEIGHDSADGEWFYDRLRRHGLSDTIAAENIAYGPPSPRDVVRALIIDSGVPSRGHRRNIFHESFRVVGVSCGPHRSYSTMCVMDFGGVASGLRTASLGHGRAGAEEE